MRNITRLLVLAATLCVAGTVTATALADNGSFESGNLDGWNVSTPSGSASVQPGGAPGGGSSFGAVTAGNQDEDQSISFSVHLEAGDAISAAGAFYNAESTNECFYDDNGSVVVMFGGNVVATIAAGNSCNAANGAGAWSSGLVYATQDGVYTVIARVRNVGDGVVSSQIWVDAVQARTPRAAYCAAEGNTLPDGTAVRAGSFLNLRTGQPAKDPHFKGATLARFVEGLGLTCDAPPAGFVQSGLAGDAQHVPDGLYALYKQA